MNQKAKPDFLKDNVRQIEKRISQKIKDYEDYPILCDIVPILIEILGRLYVFWPFYTFIKEFIPISGQLIGWIRLLILGIPLWFLFLFYWLNC